jgi:hypothetical protein
VTPMGNSRRGDGPKPASSALSSSELLGHVAAPVDRRCPFCGWQGQRLDVHYSAEPPVGCRVVALALSPTYWPFVEEKHKRPKCGGHMGGDWRQRPVGKAAEKGY